MKIKITVLIAVVVIAIGGYKISISEHTQMSALVLSNIEALAVPEVTIPYICAGSEPACYDEYYHEVFDGYRVR